MEKINIAELLKDCPQGMELYCLIYEDCYFLDIDAKSNNYLIRITTPCGIKYLDKYGCYTTNDKAKCVIFPKGKTTWEGFVPPCQFKDGDIIYNENILATAILKENYYGSHSHSYCFLNIMGDFKISHRHSGDLSDWRFATEEEKQKLFDTIKDNGYRWNPETKTLEELPIFKVGDRIRHKDNGICCTLGEYSEGISAYRTNIGLSITHKDLEQWELVQNKFDIASLKPFDKVLVRNNSSETWHIQFFENYNRQYGAKYPFVCMCNKYSQCIPFKYNEHLVDTANNCDDYFKIWKDE